MTYSIFEHLKDLSIRKTSWDSYNPFRVSSYEPYQINRWFSMNVHTIKYAEEANLLKFANKETHYEFYLSVIPQREFYFKYIKVKEDKLKEACVDILGKYFLVGRWEANRKYNLIAKKDLQKIVNLYDRNLKVFEG